jgi:hypothetical protein
MDRAFGLASSNGVLLSTDADAVPDPNWIDATLRAVAGGAELVGGHIVGDKAEEAALGPGFVRRAARHLEYARLTDHLESLMLPVAHDPWPRHSDHTGASLAVRADIYAALGGIPPLPFREDVAFVDKALAAGYQLRHPLDVIVTVSARLDGRARGGMADCLKSWVEADTAGDSQLVQAPSSIFARLATKQQQCSGARPIAGELNFPSDESTDIDSALNQMRQLVAEFEGVRRVR